MAKSPASQCPVCRRDLSPAEALLDQCPHCGGPLSQEGPDAGAATVLGIGQTVSPEDLEVAPPATRGEEGAGRETVAPSQQHPTLDERGLPAGGPPQPPPGGQTIDERALGQTLDEDALRALSPSPPEKAPRTVDERHVSQTFDSADFAPGRAAGTVPERAIDRTLDSADLSGNVEARLNHLWGDAVQPGARPGMTIKGPESGNSWAESNLKIQQRTLRQAGDCKTREADYELLKHLGEGGMGVVYTARQASIDRTVAVKMIRASSAAEPGSARSSSPKPSSPATWTIRTSCRSTTWARTSTAPCSMR